MTDVYRSFLLNLPIDCARRHFPPTALRPCSPSRRRELPSQTPPPPERAVGKSNADGATFSSNIHLFSLFLAALLSSNSSRVIFRRTISCFGFSQLSSRLSRFDPADRNPGLIFYLLAFHSFHIRTARYFVKTRTSIYSRHTIVITCFDISNSCAHSDLIENFHHWRSIELFVRKGKKLST